MRHRRRARLPAREGTEGTQDLRVLDQSERRATAIETGNHGRELWMHDNGLGHEAIHTPLFILMPPGGRQQHRYSSGGDRRGLPAHSSS